MKILTWSLKTRKEKRMSKIEFDPTDADGFVDALSPHDLMVVGKAIFKAWEDKGGKLAALSRCPVCNHVMKNWHQYKPTWTQVQFCFKIVEILSQENKHVHIKSSLSKLPLQDRDHALTGDIMNHYSKMLYLNLITRCDESGTELGHFVDIDERDDSDGKYSRFTITKQGYEFITGKEALQPALVRVKEKEIIDVPENRESKVWVREIVGNDRDKNDAWLDAVGRHRLYFPAELLPDTKGLLFAEET